MYNKFLKQIFMTIVLMIIISNKLFAAEIPTAPTKNIYVADYAKMIDESDKNEILKLGEELDKKFKAQIVIVTIESLDGLNIEEYANKLFRSWGIGDKTLNNGVLLLIAKNDREFRIEVGYGLEGAITDGFAGEILDGMKNNFRDEKYSVAIISAYGKLAQKVYQEYGSEVPESVNKASERSDEWTLSDYGFLALFIMPFLGCLYFFIKIIKTSINNDVEDYSSNNLLNDDDGDSDNDSSGGYGGGSSGGGGASGKW